MCYCNWFVRTASVWCQTFTEKENIFVDVVFHFFFSTQEPLCDNTVVWSCIYSSGVQRPAVMDLDTSLETMPPTGGTFVKSIIYNCVHEITDKQTATVNHASLNAHVLSNFSVLQSLRLSTSQEKWHKNPPQQRGQRRSGANQVRRYFGDMSQP